MRLIVAALFCSTAVADPEQTTCVSPCDCQNAYGEGPWSVSKREECQGRLSLLADLTCRDRAALDRRESTFFPSTQQRKLPVFFQTGIVSSKSLHRHIASDRQMVRCIRLRYDWLSHQDTLTEEIIKRRVRESMIGGMRDPLFEGNCVKHAAKRTSAQSVQCFLCGEHRLISVCVKIPSTNEPIYRRHFRWDEVADMRHQLIYGDFSFADILCRFRYQIAVCDEIAFQMNGVDKRNFTALIWRCFS